MQIRIDRDLQGELKKLQKKDPQLTKRIEKQLALFTSDPAHPSLRVHKLSGKLDNMRSISITKSVRMIYVLLDNNEAYFFDIGTHEDVYRR